MRHPHIVPSVGVRIAQDRVRRMHEAGFQILDDLEEDIKDKVSWHGAGERIDLSPFQQAQRNIEQLIAGQTKLDGSPKNCDHDMFEGKAAVIWHGAVIDSGADIVALDNPGFWCYLGLIYTWNFAVWRQKDAFKLEKDENGRPQPTTKLKVYVEGNKNRDCVPLRMYLRLKVLGGQNYADLAHAVRYGRDFWASHILSVIAGEYPPVVRAMVRRQSDASTRLSAGTLREFAKQLNRTINNVVPDLLDDAAADDLVGDLWQRVRHSTESL